jgi:putative SOS response-associated peptidase YedK
MRTINCRDDSLAESKSMWVSMKKRKRCIVICQGFYEWLKKNNGKDRIPHYIKRKDNQLMCFAGLWDVVHYKGSEEKIYSYTIITTDSNKQLKWLHDRMPVIFNPGDEAIRTWLDPNRHEWTRELQSLLKPFSGELEIYPVIKDVGKVGNDSPSFIIPIDSEENKNNIANFFNKKASAKPVKEPPKDTEADSDKALHSTVKSEQVEITSKAEEGPDSSPTKSAVKRSRDEFETGGVGTDDSPIKKAPKPSQTVSEKPTSPAKPTRKTRSATSNGTLPKTNSPAKKGGGSQKITSFFGKK